MSTPEAPEPDTSLELPATTPPAADRPSASLDLPTTASQPAPATETVAPPPPRSPGSLVLAQLLRVEVAMLARVLATILAGALPPSMIEVEYVRSAGDVLRRRPGQAVGVRIATGTALLGFRAPDVGVTQAYVSHVVRGIVLSTEQVSVPDWLARLAEILDAEARHSSETSAALQHFINDRT